MNWESMRLDWVAKKKRKKSQGEGDESEIQKVQPVEAEISAALFYFGARRRPAGGRGCGWPAPRESNGRRAPLDLHAAHRSSNKAADPTLGMWDRLRLPLTRSRAVGDGRRCRLLVLAHGTEMNRVQICGMWFNT
jgi:hypothetical protein